MTEQRTSVMKGVTWANSDKCTALTMMIEQGTSVMKGETWANSVTYSTYYVDRAEDICYEGCNMG